jgi:hypothetical protein
MYRYVPQSSPMSAVRGIDVVRGTPHDPALMLRQTVGKKTTANPALARAMRRSIKTDEPFAAEAVVYGASFIFYHIVPTEPMFKQPAEKPIKHLSVDLTLNIEASVKDDSG